MNSVDSIQKKSEGRPKKAQNIIGGQFVQLVTPVREKFRDSNGLGPETRSPVGVGDAGVGTRMRG